MFREMRRSDKLKTVNETIEILNACTNGVLSVNGEKGYPYGVPVSYVYNENQIIFHCALTGYKLDSIKKDPKVSFCVVGADNINAAAFTTVYKSVICFGKAHIVDGDEEKEEILKRIVKKYSAEYYDDGMDYMKQMWGKTACVVIDIEHMTGKGLAK
ncbi:MAG: pyridoxamine 5'-phosphate oxidase family protein [Lentihominibacter sp.]